jgi:SAM-dependent methyltransferase
LTEQLQARTIADFGEQWTAFPETDGFFGSAELFEDFVGPLVRTADLAGCRVCEIGAGTGRFVNVLVESGAAHVIALEPSAAFDVLRSATSAHADRVSCLRLTGDRLLPSGDLDYVFSIGVLHHIPDPDPVIAAAYGALRPGGTIAIWLYGREGNTVYLAAASLLWRASRRLSHRPLLWLVFALYPVLWCYMTLCRWVSLPLAAYMRKVMFPLTPAKRRVVLYDQLNPAYAKYYTRQEAGDLIARAGFVDVRMHHRHGMSWTVVGTKPA